MHGFYAEIIISYEKIYRYKISKLKIIDSFEIETPVLITTNKFKSLQTSRLRTFSNCEKNSKKEKKKKDC